MLTYSPSGYKGIQIRYIKKMVKIKIQYNPFLQPKKKKISIQS